MLSDEMEDDKVGVHLALSVDAFALDMRISVGSKHNLSVLHKTFIVLNESVVESVELVVTQVKLSRTEGWVIEEEATREVVDSLPGRRQELVGKESNLIACLSEELGEEGIVTPLALLTHDMHGEYIFEDEAGEVPTGDHIVELRQPAASLQFLLAGRVLDGIAIELAMGLAIALTDDEHDGRRLVGAGVHLHMLGCFHTFLYLLGSQLIAIDGERQAIDREIELAMVMLGEDMLHGANGVGRHQLRHSLLILPTGGGTPYHKGQDGNTALGIEHISAQEV